MIINSQHPYRQHLMVINDAGGPVANVLAYDTNTKAALVPSFEKNPRTNKKEIVNKKIDLPDSQLVWKHDHRPVTEDEIAKLSKMTQNTERTV